MSEYNKNRDPRELGEHFTRHMLAMTAEDLYEKADIAMELAHRDKELEAAKAKLAEYESRKCEACMYSSLCYRHIMVSDDRVILFTNQTGCPAWKRIDDNER